MFFKPQDEYSSEKKSWQSKETIRIQTTNDNKFSATCSILPNMIMYGEVYVNEAIGTWTSEGGWVGTFHFKFRGWTIEGYFKGTRDIKGNEAKFSTKMDLHKTNP